MIKELVTIAVGIVPTAVIAGTLTYSWQAPTHRINGEILDNLAGYRLYWGCEQSGVYPNTVQIDNPGVTGYVLEGLPDGKTCYAVVTAFDATGLESVYSNEVSKVLPLPTLDLPGAIHNLDVVWGNFSSGGTGQMSTTILTDSYTGSAGQSLPTYGAAYSALGNAGWNTPDSVPIISSAGGVEAATDTAMSAAKLDLTQVGFSAGVTDIAVQVDVIRHAFSTTGSIVVLFARQSNDGLNHYYLDLRGDGQWFLRKTVGGTDSLLTNGSLTLGTLPGALRLEVVGTTVRAFWKGAQVGTAEDSDITSGDYIGFLVRSGFSTSTPTEFDNLLAYSPSERLPPNIVNESSNFNGTASELLAKIARSPDLDTTWAETLGVGVHGHMDIGFYTPPTPPSGWQLFRIQVRKNAAGGNPIDFQFDIEEDGTTIIPEGQDVLVVEDFDDAVGQVFEVYWNADWLVDSTGAGAGVEITQFGGGNGADINDRWFEVGGVEWVQNVDAPGPAITSVGTDNVVDVGEVGALIAGSGFGL